MVLLRILRDVRFERDARALEKDHLARPIVLRRVAVIRVVERTEIRRDANGVALRLDILEHARVPHALLAFTVRAVAIQVSELAHERALADSRSADDGYTHG